MIDYSHAEIVIFLSFPILIHNANLLLSNGFYKPSRIDSNLLIYLVKSVLNYKTDRRLPYSEIQST